MFSLLVFFGTSHPAAIKVVLLPILIQQTTAFSISFSLPSRRMETGLKLPHADDFHSNFFTAVPKSTIQSISIISAPVSQI